VRRVQIGAEAIVCGAIALIYILFVGSLVPEFGRAGWSVGPRYIAVAMPFLAWLAAAGFGRVDQRPLARGAAQTLVWIGVAVFVLAAATFPHWPAPHFRNPVHEVALRLVSEGMAPHSLATAIGLRGIAAYAPLFVGVIALAAWLMAGRDRKRWLVTGIAALAAALVLYGYSYFPDDAPDAERGWRFIERIWEP